MRVLFDSSALYKRYNAEAGREQVLAASERASEVVVAAHCKAEIAWALNRQRAEGLVDAGDGLRPALVHHIGVEARLGERQPQQFGIGREIGFCKVCPESSTL